MFLILVLYANVISGQIYNALNVTKEDGLSDSNVKTICVDHMGYVWFGTQHGLNRYDGFEMQTFYHDANDNSSINDNRIREIYEDKGNRLWVVTQSGVNYFNPELQSFSSLEIKNTSSYVRILHESDSTLWFYNSNTFYIHNKKTKALEVYPVLFQRDALANTNWEIQQACDFDSTYLLVSVTAQGLFLVDKNSKVLKPFYSLPYNFYCGLEKQGDDIWVASSFSGLTKINKKNGTIKHYNGNNSELSHEILIQFKSHPLTNNLWMATDGGGVQEFDTAFNLVNSFQSGPYVDQILPGNEVQSLNFTKNGEVWLGTVRDGATLIFESNFEHFASVKESDAGPSGNSITKIIEDEDKNIWLATDGGGLNKFDKTTNSFKSFKQNGIKKITGVVPFTKDVLLVAAFLDKLYFFNKNTETFTDAHKHPLLKEIGQRSHYRLTADSSGKIWIFANELYCINLKENKSVQLSNKNSDTFSLGISPAFYTSFEDKKNKKIWFGSQGGFYAYNYSKNRFEDVVSLNNSRNSYGNEVRSIIVDRNGLVLFGTTKGLFKYNTDTQLVSPYFKTSKFANTKFQLLWETGKTLWAATSNGILKINSELEGNNITVYEKDEHDFRFGSFLKNEKGEVFLGTNNGILRFTPKEVFTDTISSNVWVTKFELVGTKEGSEISTVFSRNTQSLALAKIPYSSSTYKFSFNSFDLPQHEKILYSYLLDGFEEIWNIGKERSANYTNLTPGKYTFKVKASTPNGIWNEKTTNISFEVLPPWWQTTWFRILIVFVVLTIASLIWMESLKRAKLKHLLAVEKNEQKRLNEINQMKLRFFTNISHELRTPLTLIYSPLKKVVGKNVSIEEIKNELPGIYRNSHRMKVLVDQILEFRKAEMDELKLNLSSSNLIELCREVLDTFHFMARTEGIDIKLIYADKSIFFYFDKDKLTKILYNLFSNALKCTSPGGIIELIVDTEPEWVNIRVKDNGKGIPDSKLDSIFDRYFQGDTLTEGTGIGLALSKKLVELHGGKIWAESEIGEGATFVVKLPFKKQFEIVHTNDAIIGEVELENEPDVVRTFDKELSEKNISMLIIEDDLELRYYLEKEFSKDYEVFTADNGRTGLLQAVEHLPDIIITDVMMPELDGYGFCKSLRDDLRISHIPVVMLTAKTMAEHEIEGYKSGADLYVSKPFDTFVLHAQVNALLKNREVLKGRFNMDLVIKVEEVTNSKMDEKFLQKAISTVELNLQNTQFNVDSLIAELGISRTLAYKKIKAISGKSINEFILSIRLQKACMILKQTSKTISEIATETGFSDHSYFSAVFKKNFKVSPSDYRHVE